MSTTVPFEIVVLVVVVALGFDFMNGFHDAANSFATLVSTRVLTPRVAVLWAAFFNFVAAFVFGVNIASTIGEGTIDPKIVTALAATCGSNRRHLLGRHNMVVWITHKFVPRPSRRPHWRRRCKGRMGRSSSRG